MDTIMQSERWGAEIFFVLKQLFV